MCAGLVLLANSATSDKVVNEYGEAQPPEVALYNSLSAEASKMT